jgi:preprotein translocase subunit SecD
MTVEEAKDLAIILNAGALPVQTYLIEEGIVP